MLAAIRLTAQVLLGVALFEVALGALGPLAVLQLERRGVETGLIGVVVAAYYAGFLLGTLYCHHIIDRVGHIRAFAVFTVIAINATLLHAVFQHPLAWLALRACLGFGLAGVFVVAESWLNDKATADTRSRIFSLYTAVAWGAAALGPLALNLKDSTGILLFCLITLFMASALLPVALTTVGNPEIGHRAHFGILRLYRISPLGVLACFASGIINASLFQLLPVYTEKLGLSAAQLSLLLSAATIAPLFLQFPIGWLADRFGRRPLMLSTVLAAILLSSAIMRFGPDSFPLLVALTVLLTSMLAPLYGLGVGQTGDYIAKTDFVAASAGLLFAWGVGAFIGPIVAAPAIALAGPNGLFYFISGCHGILAAFILYRMVVRRALSAKEQGNYVPVAVAHGSAAAELDPRAERQPMPAQASRVIGATVD
jgi:MFS family permease